MKVKEGFILRKVLDKYIVVPYGLQAKEKPSMLTLTDSAAMLWSAMEKDVSVEELVQLLSQAFPEIPENTLKNDTLLFIDRLKTENYLTIEN